MTDLDAWACPVCLSGLSESEEGLHCTSEGRTFPRRSGLRVLLRPEEDGLLREAEGYAAAWRLGGFAPPRGSLPELPYVRNTFWKQKARSLEALLRILGPPAGRKVADIGAGTGWLSFRLSMAGFRCFATDINADPEVGLGAARVFDSAPHRFERAIASMTRWPFRDASIDIALCNASLHYLADIRPAIAEAARVLRPDGRFVVMNEPVHCDRTSAERAALEFRDRLLRLGGRGSLVDHYRHFVASDLETGLRSVFAHVERHDPDYGFSFRATRAAKGIVLGMELASFPIYVSWK